MRIEKNVPLPKNLTDRVVVGLLPLARMKVNDSIVVEAATQRELDKKLKSLRIRLARYSKKHPHFKFRLAKEEAKDRTHIRIWRVSRAG
jgi:hypothetical protein